MNYKYTYLLLLPALLLTAAFSYSTWFGIITAFQDFDVLKGVANSPFVGVKNFSEIFTGPQFLKAIRNTLFFSSFNLIFGFPCPIILALILNELKNGVYKKSVQTISYLPHFLSWASVVAMFTSFFALEGTFNDIRLAILGEGAERINILTKSDYFLGIIFSTAVWKSVGWNSIIFLAALSGIDPGLYEAANIDGCGKFRQIWHITIPGIMGTIILLFIINSGNLISSNFEQIFGFQNLYIQEDTEVINTLVYRQGILGGEYSKSTAFGLSQGIVSFILVFTTNKIAKKVSGYGIW